MTWGRAIDLPQVREGGVPSQCRASLAPHRLPSLVKRMPDEAPKKLVVVGDRVLIVPEEGEERTGVGLYLPATAVQGQQVQSGRIIATGPGTPTVDPTSIDDEPWKIPRDDGTKYVPMQA